ncbi:2-oxoglutarate and iron-dependent oxygenase JMJD4 homolog isoform X1 [Bactrocera dorsalis]|uniref:Jumonji domain-containing protein 4 n=1 Tax=Bactrocera dorsalis TaxID=27457 RepID=A0ABM3IXY2_BACDO|nr:2-oxoglutarate and iron-dependent oxygenase JMJD4 homolog isoform X1 [Bactrocera dorsalis]
MIRLDLKNCIKLDTHLKNDIIRFGVDEISYNTFYREFINQNWPAVITNISSDWECSHTWILRENAAQMNINFAYLKDKIKDCLVPVTNCMDKSVSVEVQFYDYIDKWEKSILSRNSVEDTVHLYLKDWHLKAYLRNYEFYNVPKHFFSDWLNEFLTENHQDDYRFVYMGPKNTCRTPFHVDVFGSFSWSANIYGCKKWILLPPGEELKLLDQYKKLPCEIIEDTLRKSNIKYFVVYQQQNEAIFVPSGWYHQVFNITDTISVNHNWFNAANLKYIWNNISSNLRKVVIEINDFRRSHNFNEQCQRILHVDFGLNIAEFLEILCFIAKRRLFLLKKQGNSNIKNIQCPSSNMFYINDFHIYYDLENIDTVLKTMIQDKFVHSCSRLYNKCIKFINRINQYTSQINRNVPYL